MSPSWYFNQRSGLLAISLLSVMTLLFSANTAAQDEPVEPHFVQVTLEPAKAAVGEHMKLKILIGVDTYFANAPRLSLPNIEHALVLETESALNMGQRIGGTYYATQLRQVDIYPDREGIMLIPSFNISFTQSMMVDDEMTQVPVQIASGELLGLVTIPPEMQGEQGFLVSHDVQVDDQWEGLKEASYEVGDVLQRTVTVTASDTASMIMPQFTPIVPKGISVILAEPAISSTNGRDGESSTMVQHINYAIEKPGDYQLGTENLAWWDPVDKKRNDHAFSPEPIDAGGLPWRQISYLAMVLIVSLILIDMAVRYRRKRDQIDLAIKKDLRSNDAGKRMAALYAYADHHKPVDTEPAQLRFWLASSLPLLEKVMTARFSKSQVDEKSPSYSQSNTLFHHLKRVFKRNPQQFP